MKHIAKTMSACVLAVVMACSTTSAFAASTDVEIPESSQSQPVIVQPRIYFNGTARLTAGKWCNVTSSNNFFADDPLVTSNANNPGAVSLRVVNANGAQIGSTKKVSPGKSVRLDEIPAFSGTYTIQAYTEVGGVYTFVID